jgi:hypothetical protein
MGREKKNAVADGGRRERLFWAGKDQPTTTSLIWITGAISV